MPEVREARIFDLKNLPTDERAKYGLRILTTRRWLQGVRVVDVDYWIPDAGPSLELLKDWREGRMLWQDFVDRYKNEQLKQTTCRVKKYPGGHDAIFNISPIKYIRSEAQHQSVSLLCWEQGEHCHRHILREMVLAI